MALVFAAATQAAPITRLEVRGDPGDPVSTGQSFTFTTDSGSFTTTTSFPEGAGAAFNAPNHHWAVRFAAPRGTRLAPGAHENVPRYPFQGPTEWALNVNSNLGSCPGARSSFDIKQVRFDAFGVPQILHATFEQHCNGAPPGLYGRLVFNADTSLWINSPETVYALQGTPISFEVSAVDAEGDPIELSASGVPPGATFSDLGSGSGRLDWPGGHPDPGSFQVTIHAQDTTGYAVSMPTTIKIHGPDFIRLDSDLGHFITQGRSYFFQDSNATLLRWANTGWAASARAVTPWDDMELAFAAPYPRPLGAGRHLAQSAPAGMYPSALNLSGNHRGCNPGTGWFDIRQVEFGGPGALMKIWLVFEHHCQGSTPAVRGEVRINADTAIYVLPPADLYVRVRTDTSVIIQGTDTRGSAVTLTASGLPPGCSFTDYGTGSGELLMTPDLGTPGDYPITFTCVNGLGDEAEAVTYLHVLPPPVAADPMTPTPAWALDGPLPNPSHGDGYVSFALPDGREAMLDLIDLTGRKVRSQAVGHLGPGRHRVALPGQGLPTGLYWIRLRRDGETLSKPLVIIR